MATYVLVHGAFHGSWCWSRLIPLLEAAGHVAYGPSLTGLGDRASLLSPEVGLSTHVEDITGLIREKDLRNVILLGHSYGAMVITGVVDQVPDRVQQLVYLDSFVPRTGESMVDRGHWWSRASGGRRAGTATAGAWSRPRRGRSGSAVSLASPENPISGGYARG